MDNSGYIVVDEGGEIVNNGTVNISTTGEIFNNGTVTNYYGIINNLNNNGFNCSTTGNLKGNQPNINLSNNCKWSYNA